MDKGTMWSLAAKNGLILSLITIVAELLNSSFTLPKWVSIVITIVKLFLICFLLYKFMKSYTDQCEGLVTYGQSYSYGFFICLCSTIVCTLFSFIDFTWINPEMTEKMMEGVESVLANTGNIPDFDMDQFISMMPKLTIASLFIQYIFYGAIIPLIIAIYTKRETIFDTNTEE